jgi:hypothetical protein
MNKDLGILPHLNNELSQQILKTADLDYGRNLSSLVLTCFFCLDVLIEKQNPYVSS